MNATNMKRRVEALESRETGGVVVWETHDDETLVDQNGNSIHHSELPDNGALNVVVNRFIAPELGDDRREDSK